MHDVKSALDDISEALRLRPENAETRATYGDVLRAMQQHREALCEYERALVLDSELASALIGRAYCHCENGDWKNAVADFQRGIALGSKDKDAKLFLRKAEQHLRNATRPRK
jgi:tetratricopeptide (TPR) repeat protein